MLTLLNGIKNWKTSIAGFLSGLMYLITNIDKLISAGAQDKMTIVGAAIALIFGGFFAKDGTVTGVSTPTDKVN